MVAVMQSVGVDGISPNQIRNGDSVTTLRLAADLDTASLSGNVIRQLNLQLSDNSVSVSISFENPVTTGQFVPMKEAQDAPIVSVEGTAANDESYTYILIDIDAPDPKAPTHSPFLHYILSGLAVKKQDAQDQQQGVVVVPYYPVSPPVGEHRYISLLFRQQESGPDAQDAALTAKRSNFDVSGYTKKHKLDLVATNTFHSHPAAQDD
eukprot:jgi/Phyca11/533149/estExt2_fgenesh1_pg.C_PHYCAscaffold_110014